MALAWEMHTCLATYRPAHPPTPPPADGSLDVALRPGRVDWSTIVADLSVASPGLCRGLFEIYLGSESGACADRVRCRCRPQGSCAGVLLCNILRIVLEQQWFG